MDKCAAFLKKYSHTAAVESAVRWRERDGKSHKPNVTTFERRLPDFDTSSNVNSFANTWQENIAGDLVLGIY